MRRPDERRGSLQCLHADMSDIDIDNSSCLPSVPYNTAILWTAYDPSNSMDHPNMDHGGMDMGEDQCSMNVRRSPLSYGAALTWSKMLFTWSTHNLCIVFRGWRIAGPLSLLLSLAAIALLTAGYEGLREVSRQYELSHSSRMNAFSSSSSSTPFPFSFRCTHVPQDAEAVKAKLLFPTNQAHCFR